MSDVILSAFKIHATFRRRIKKTGQIFKYRRDANMLLVRIMAYLAVFSAAVILVIGWIGGRKP